MPLSDYKKKRRFEGTPEPRGDEAEGSLTGPLKFVVQKHKASRLHYDFRLELEGVLKSWAVPKGPSMNPDDKRLAMMVEDHPLDYRNFEGIIPEGNYGAGTVMVWDEGVYAARTAAERTEATSAMAAGLKKGHITFVLIGKKLKGEFALIKIGGDRTKEKNSWLLVKAADEYSTNKNILAEDRSAVTGRTLDEIARQAKSKGQVWISDRSHAAEAGTAKSVPNDVRPMLASSVSVPFNKEGWFFEIKWDGFRTMAKTGPGGRLYSRNLNSFDSLFPPILEKVRKLPFTALLDGEVVALADDGRPNFQMLQNPEENLSSLVFYVFDILHLDGESLLELPLRERKKILKKLVPKSGSVRYSEHIEERGKDFFRLVRDRGLEGIIAKDSGSAYLPGRRTKSWLKIKATNSTEAVITGFTQPRGSRVKFGSLVLGVFRGGKLTYAGHAGTGLDEGSLAALHRRLKKLITNTSPFADPPKTNAPVTWVRPELACEVNYAEWTSDGRLRQPVFKGLRPDKDPSEIEAPSGPNPNNEISLMRDESKTVLKIAGKKVEVTNLSKIYWPDDGYTKGDLIDYYRSVKKLILPHLKDRPQTLHRFPNGIAASGFYQKDMTMPLPEWVPTAPIRHDEKQVNYLLVQDEASLVFVANLGCIELHPFNSRTDRVDFPDYLVIDLDPEAIGFEKVKETALVVHEILEEIKIASFCKTSGASGLHIYVPLQGLYDYGQAKQFGKIVATIAHSRLPDITSLERSPSKRQNRVYLDYLQNNRGQTLAAVYSLRPLPGAPVSTPLEWSELKKPWEPEIFNIKTALRRFEKKGDLFRRVLNKGADLANGLKRLEKLR